MGFAMFNNEGKIYGSGFGRGFRMYDNRGKGLGIEGNDLIQAIADTNSVNLTVAANTLTADVNIQDTPTVNLSIDALGLKAEVLENNLSSRYAPIMMLMGG